MSLKDFKQAKVAKTMREYSEGTLKSFRGPKVTDRRQAIAIGLAEASKGKGLNGWGKRGRKW